MQTLIPIRAEEFWSNIKYRLQKSYHIEEFINEYLCKVALWTNINPQLQAWLKSFHTISAGEV